MADQYIHIRGARQHNLKNIDLRLPRNKLVVITGPSGSGKSSLAFDTLYAEGQRRYVESLSAYARQFLERMEKPEVDLIEGLSPAIAIEQKTASHNPRSTVGTVTEIYDYLRLLFARVGTPHCQQCGQAIASESLDQMVDQAMALPAGTRTMILAPLVKGRKGTHAPLLKRLRKEGFARVRIDQQVFDIEAVPSLDGRRAHDIDAVVDRVIIKPAVRNRLADSLELALALSDGLAMVEVLQGRQIHFSEKAACKSCGTSYPVFTPASFSFNSPHGACGACGGLGVRAEFDPHLIIPNPNLSLREGAVAPWAHRHSVFFTEFLMALTRHYGVDIFTPYAQLPETFQKVLLHGSKGQAITFSFEQSQRLVRYQKPFEGVMAQLQRRYKETDSHQGREELQRFMTNHPCPDCDGTRLNPASRAVRVSGVGIHEISAMGVTQALEALTGMQLKGQQAVIAARVIKEIHQRLGFMRDVGLGYLTLDRAAHTLSGGESQRIRLATQIGSKLTGVLYVLDEPSIGLHQRDNRRLLDTLIQMRELGNTVLVVEHDEESIQSADHVVDMGPGAGGQGGQVVFAGSPDDLLQDADSLTGQYLSGRKRIEVPTYRRQGSGRTLLLKGARQNNLKNIDVPLPLNCFICVTGVSGSGKSTLVLETLHRALAQRLYQARLPAGRHRCIEGLEYVDKVVNIDQAPIGRTPRSNPGTYTGVFNHMRELFARTPDARMRGYKPGRFSFNVKGGRCEACKGDGIIKIEMHFLPDVYVPCDVCRGKRYNRETMEVRYKGKTIADVLDMTVNQGLDFFANFGQIRHKLQILADVGLGYIHLGQSATTLSGGEAQRVKLAKELSKKGTGNSLYILDEPTTGLHTDDIRRLLEVLGRLVDAGNTVLVIEHNLDVIKTADHIVDLGPEGGDEGGQIVAAGTPEQIAACPYSYTGQYLAKVLETEV